MSQRAGACAGRARDGPGPPRAAHLDLDAPRAVVRWGGWRWKLVAIVDNLAAAQDLVRPEKPGLQPW
ncbi:DUF6087 family protein [Streptomyces ochraceiscleroticus]|uniref:DUF6087 family protein n=1 Tax=Streptomyces ochraceiscleroticus TaxID=47761 RepID=A0ABW1MJ00_9ACTN